MKKAVTVTVLGALTVLLLAGADGCESSQDAGVSERDKGPARVIVNMPDGYSNVAAKCEGPNMVYVIYHGNSSEGARPYGALAVVPNDPRCTPVPR